MVEMIANKQIQGDGYRAAKGERFMVKEEVAESLASRGIADYYYEPLPAYSTTYETKVIVPEPVQFWKQPESGMPARVRGRR